MCKLTSNADKHPFEGFGHHPGSLFCVIFCYHAWKLALQKWFFETVFYVQKEKVLRVPAILLPVKKRSILRVRILAIPNRLQEQMPF